MERSAHVKGKPGQLWPGFFVWAVMLGPNDGMKIKNGCQNGPDFNSLSCNTDVRFCVVSNNMKFQTKFCHYWIF